MVARRHHYISQCYLRGFTAEPTAPLLHVTDFKTRRQFRTSPSNVALQQNFHTIDSPDHPPDAVEKRIAVFESDLAPALLRIREARSLADENDKELLMLFMALLTIKNPRMRDTIGSLMGDAAKTDMKILASDAERWALEMARAKVDGTISQDADTDEIRRLVLEDAFTYGVTTGGHLEMEFDLVLPLLPFFSGREWTVFAGPSDRASFVTSDNPVCLMWQDPQRTDPPGLGRRGTQIIFPVANELAILGTFEGGEPAVADDRIVPIVNGNILSYVTRQVYARDDDFQYSMPHNERTMLGRELLSDPVSGCAV